MSDHLAQSTLPSDHTTIAGESLQFLTFMVGDAVYGMDITQVREIKGWTETTRLPNTEPYLLGVMNLRGTIVPVFDLRCRFSGELTEATPKHVVIIMVLDGKQAGVLVDGVSDILTATAEDIRPVPQQEAALDSRYLNGILTAGERMVVLLSMDTLLSGNLPEAQDYSTLSVQ